MKLYITRTLARTWNLSTDTQTIASVADMPAAPGFVAALIVQFRRTCPVDDRPTILFNASPDDAARVQQALGLLH